MRAEKTVRVYVRGCSNTVARGEGAQALAFWRLADIGVAQATFGGRLPVGNNQGHGGRLTEIEARDLRYRNRQQAHGAAAVYFEDCEG